MMNHKMRNRMLTLVLATTVAVPFSAMAEPELYGKIHLNFGTLDDGTDSNWQLNSVASRVGIKGKHNLSKGLDATYKLEYEIDPDTGGNVWANRNQYVGFKGKFGEIRIGRHDTPLKKVQGKFDQFGDNTGDLKNAGDQDGDNRWANTIVYMGKSGKFGYGAAIAPSEGNGTTAGDGIVDNLSGSFSFTEGPIYVGVGYDIHDDTNPADTANTMYRLVGLYKMDNMQFGGLIQSGVESGTTEANEEDWLGLSFSMKLSKGNKLKAQYIMVEDNQATSVEGTLLALGFDHKYSKAITTYAMYSDLTEEQGAATITELTSLSIGLIVKL